MAYLQSGHSQLCTCVQCPQAWACAAHPPLNPPAGPLAASPAVAAASAVMTDPYLLPVPAVAGRHHLQHGLVLLCSVLAAVLLCALALQHTEMHQPSGI